MLYGGGVEGVLTMSEGWVRAFPTTALAEGSRKLFRHHDKRIAVFRDFLLQKIAESKG